MSSLNAVIARVDDRHPRHENYRYMLIAFSDLFEKETVVGTTLAAEEMRLDSWSESPIGEYGRYRMNFDLGRVLWTIGRFTEAASLWMREIDRLPQKDIRDSTIPELEYLRELGASMNDVFELLSWTIDFQSSGQYSARIEEALWLKDFAPTWMDRAFGRGDGRPYGAVSPEEDRATCLEAYGAVLRDPDLAQLLSGVIEEHFGYAVAADEIARDMRREFVSWAKEERETR